MKLKKLKLDKKFQALPINEDDEIFPNGIFEFNITKLLEFIKINPDMFQPEEVDVETVRTFPSSGLKEETVENANLLYPIVLAEISPGRFNIIDGNHRLEKAYRDGVKKIAAYKVNPQQHVRFLTSEKAYKAYIDYWNSKIDDNYQSQS